MKQKREFGRVRVGEIIPKWVLEEEEGSRKKMMKLMGLEPLSKHHMQKEENEEG